MTRNDMEFLEGNPKNCISSMNVSSDTKLTDSKNKNFEIDKFMPTSNMPFVGYIAKS